MEKFKTREESYAAYKQYVDTHIATVQKVILDYERIIMDFIAKWGEEHNAYSAEFVYKIMQFAKLAVKKHDASKYDDEEFFAYAAKFYPCEEDTDRDAIEEDFKAAWKHHYMFNTHHPESYIAGNPEDEVINDKRKIPMPLNKIIEMLCDWIAVSKASNGSLYEWWIKSAMDEKKKLLLPDTFDLVDSFIKKYYDIFDFRKSREK